MRLRPSLVVALLLLAPPALAQDVSPVASHTIVSVRRTLHVFPFKGLIASETGWRRVTKGLFEPPPEPDFSKTVCALVVADLSGDAGCWISSLQAKGTELDITLVRIEALRLSLNPKLEAFFLVVPRTFTGVRLTHKTQLRDGAGMIQRSFPALPTDSDRRLLPRLGPDLRLSFAMADGSTPPSGMMLRYEATYPQGNDARAGHEEAIPFPAAGLPFPRLRDQVRHTYAAYAPGLRSTNPLIIRRLPRKGPDGNPLPIQHVFVLEPAPR